MKIFTHMGELFDFDNPTPDMICIEDIAYSLSNLCRYTGHTNKFYSVAEHCIRMAEADLPGDPLVRLLHDSAEAYIGDINRPFKETLHIKKCEENILNIIGKSLGVKIEITPEIKVADNRMLSTEVWHLFKHTANWHNLFNDFLVAYPPIFYGTFSCLSPDDAYNDFLDLYYELNRER